MVLRRFVWLRRLALAGGIAACLGWLPYLVYGQTGLKRIVAMRTERDGLRRETATLRAESVRLRAEIALYDEDELGTIERVAREELGFVRPGEIVFRIEDTE